MQPTISWNAERLALQITWVNLFLNLSFTVLQLFVGYWQNSTVLMADAGHTFADSITDIVAIWALQMSNLPKDSNHPYGHGKFETLGTLFVSIFLVLTGLTIGYQAFVNTHSALTPGFWAMVVAFLTIVLKESMYQVTFRIGERTDNNLLKAGAWHHRSDALSSVVTLLGIVFARYGLPIMDPIAAMLIAILIIRTGIKIGLGSVRELSDETVEQNLLEQLKSVLNAILGVEKYHQIRARKMGHYYIVDLHIQVNSLMSVSAAHQVAERVRMAILQKLPKVNEVLVHVDAEDDTDEKMTQLMRPQFEIEKDIREALAQIPQIYGISHILCHYLQGHVTVQLEIVVDPNLRVFEVQNIARQARQKVEAIGDIAKADIHLELEDA